MSSNKKRDKLIDAILVVVLILTIGIILFLAKSNVFNKDNNVIEEVIIPNDGFEKVSISELEKKLSKLSFVNKKQDYIKNSNITLNTNITNGKVTISIKIKKVKREYIVDEIEDAKSIGSYLVSNEKHISYILTDSGKIYKIEDDLNEVSSNENYKGTIKDLGLTNIESIAIDHTLKLSLLNDKEKIKPYFYAKSDDNRVFSDESFIEGKDIVEVINEEIKEQTNENASNN